MTAFNLFCGIAATLMFFVKSFESLKLFSSRPIHSWRNVQMSDKAAITSLATESPLDVILLVEPTPFGYVSGYQNRFKEMLKWLHKAGDKLRILTADRDPNPPTEFLSFPIVTNRGYEFPLYNHVTLTFDLKLETRRLIEEKKPDILHVVTPSSLVWPAVLWSWRYDIPLVMSYHTDFMEYAKTYGSALPGHLALAAFLLRRFHAHADLVLCTSPQLKDGMESLGIQRVDVWQKGINAERFSPCFRDQEMRNKLSEGNSDAPLLLYVGRLGKEKKIERLRTVLEANPGARLALVGRGPAEQELKEYFKDYPVYFAGQYVGDELSKAYASSDIFLMASDSETLGFVVLEAMASGIPAVCVAAGGLVDIVQDGVTGFLVSNTDGMKEFTAATQKLISDSELRKTIGSNGRTWAEGWSWEAATSKLRNIQYRQAIANRAARKAAEAEVLQKELAAADAALEKVAYLYRPDLAW